MPYSPPAGNDVVFNFTISGYLPPTGNRVIFNFGAVQLPPTAFVTYVQRRANPDEEDELRRPRYGTFIAPAANLVPSWRPGWWARAEEPESSQTARRLGASYIATTRTYPVTFTTA